jgi:hypothetical protein
MAQNRRDKDWRNRSTMGTPETGLLLARMRPLRSSPRLAIAVIVLALIIMGWLIYLNHAA